MSSLREVKDRIASVRSTLKITSAMKLVASSKLRKAQRSIEALRPYEDALRCIYNAAARQDLDTVPLHAPEAPDDAPSGPRNAKLTIVLGFASNSSMCGSFNANAVKKALGVIKGVDGPVELWSFGKKMAEGMRKAGVAVTRDYMQLAARPEFEKIAEAASDLRELRSDGKVGDVILVYNRFISTGRQEIVAERWGTAPVAEDLPDSDIQDDFILEPSRSSLLESLAPQVEDLQLYAALLDSAASEHAARMVAMQAATDNAETLLSELTLEYNKGRQQKITSEILDLVSGSAN